MYFILVKYSNVWLPDCQWISIQQASCRAACGHGCIVVLKDHFGAGCPCWTKIQCRCLRHSIVFASLESHHACHPASAVTHWSPRAAQSAGFCSLYLTRLHPTSHRWNSAFSLSFHLRIEFKCLSERQFAAITIDSQRYGQTLGLKPVHLAQQLAS